MKKLIALLLVFVMVLTMVACAAKTNAPKADMPANDTKTDMPATEESKTEAPAGKIKVGFVTQSLTNASQAYAWTQFQKYAPEYGFEVTLFDEDYDSQNGVAAISTCIAEGYTAICLNPTDPAALVPALKEAKEAGIIIGLYSSDLPDESKQYRNFMCGTNDFLFGEIAAQTMMAAFPNGVKMVEVGGQSGHDAQIKRHDGFMSAINDSVTVLDSKDVAQWATEDAMAIMEDFISLYGDEIQAVFCHWDTGATGVIQALKNAGIEGVYVIGIDGCSVGYDQVREGTQALCIGQSFSQMTQDAFTCITKLMNGDVLTAMFAWYDYTGTYKINIGNGEWPEVDHAWDYVNIIDGGKATCTQTAGNPAMFYLIVSNTCKHPEEAVKLLQLMLSNEYYDMAFYGYKDVDWYYDENGNRQRNLDSDISKGYLAGGMSWFVYYYVSETFEQSNARSLCGNPNFDMEHRCYMWVDTMTVKNPIAALPLLDTYTESFNDITDVTSEYGIKFVMGGYSFDQWDEYLSDLDAVGLEEMMVELNDWYKTVE